MPPRNRGEPGVCFSAYTNSSVPANIGQVHSTRIRILAVDQNSLLREGLSLLILLHPDMELIGSVASAEEGVQSFEKHRPDVTLMYLDLPLAAGLAAIRKIRQIDPSACVLGLSTYEEDESRAQALRAGARNCVTKDRLDEDLISMMRNCARKPA